MLLEQPCGQAIEAITEAGYDEEAKGGSVVSLEHRNDKKGYQAQAQESQQVGSCA